jgi:Tannase and feruloyl esterase
MASKFVDAAQRIVIPVFTLILCSFAACPVAAQNGSQFRDWNSFAKDPTAPSVKKLTCKALLSLTGYEFAINSATLVGAAGDVPEHCRVAGQILPEIQFEVNLPTAWNGRLYMFGNGGFTGEPFDAPARIASRDQALKHGFAVAATNTGHEAMLEPLASFAVDRQKLLDYAYRAVHVTAVTAKQIVHAFYQAQVSHSYFDGCSTGGRQGLISAQRFPEDFDGIVVGAPVLNFSGSLLRHVWRAQAMQTAPITKEKLSIIADRVYAKCDKLDGLADGLIDDPRKCPFHPGSDLPKCSGDADGPKCFTTAQISTLERIYDGVKAKGEQFFPGQPIGAEVQAMGPNGMSSGWEPWMISEAGRTTDAQFGESFLRYIAFAKPDPQFDLSNFNFDTDLEKMNWTARIMDATDPDLSRFQARGGKIVMYFGWADPALTPFMGVDYYEKVEAQMGVATAGFFRLFMVPGMFHCRGGVGVSTFDALTPVVQWVEKAIPPAQIIGSHVADDKVIRTRPLCPYPQVAKYRGSGSIDDASNFACAMP